MGYNFETMAQKQTLISELDSHQLSSGVLKAELINVFYGADDHPSSSGPTQRKMEAIQVLKHGNLHTQNNVLNCVSIAFSHY